MKWINDRLYRAAELLITGVEGIGTALSILLAAVMAPVLILLSPLILLGWLIERSRKDKR